MILHGEILEAFVFRIVGSFLLMTALSAGTLTAQPEGQTSGKLEEVVAFHDSMPTGVTVSQKGRIFVNFPRWGDPVPFTVAEIKDGKPVAYPDETINKLDPARAGDTFVSVQSVVMDPLDRLWVLDTGSVKMEKVVPGGAKLVCIDLNRNRITKKILFSDKVALPTTYLNDVRFDLRKGKEGVAYITDSSDKGPNAIIVVDLANGNARRVLQDHPSTKADKNFVPTVEGKPLMQRKPGGEPKPLTIGADGIAISADGSRLFYCPLVSRRLYSVPTEALLNEKLSADELAKMVKDEGEKAASDGLESDAQGRIYATDYERNAVHRREQNGKWETIAQDPRALWPDTLSVAHDGYLYFIANQLHRQPQFHEGKDLRVKPYYLFRVKNNARPVSLR